MLGVMLCVRLAGGFCQVDFAGAWLPRAREGWMDGWMDGCVEG
jgi:hypothetical protein